MSPQTLAPQPCLSIGSARGDETDVIRFRVINRLWPALPLALACSRKAPKASPGDGTALMQPPARDQDRLWQTLIAVPIGATQNFDKPAFPRIVWGMNPVVSFCLFCVMSVAALGYYTWPHLLGTRHYTADELTGLTCAELGQRHEDVIFAYHDAALAKTRRTGTVQDDPGLPKEEVLPFVILMRKVIQDHDLDGFDPGKPFFHSASVATPRLHADFYAEVTSVCATNPAMDAVAAMLQAARTLAGVSKTDG
jgi:hypothetical protein